MVFLLCTGGAMGVSQVRSKVQKHDFTVNFTVSQIRVKGLRACTLQNISLFLVARTVVAVLTAPQARSDAGQQRVAQLAMYTPHAV